MAGGSEETARGIEDSGPRAARSDIDADEKRIRFGERFFCHKHQRSGSSGERETIIPLGSGKNFTVSIELGVSMLYSYSYACGEDRFFDLYFSTTLR
jgi:hypothetical protein